MEFILLHNCLSFFVIGSFTNWYRYDLKAHVIYLLTLRHNTKQKLILLND